MIGKEVQQGLLALFFETPLRSIAPEYAVFGVTPTMVRGCQAPHRRED